jgi:hypothetical protein
MHTQECHNHATSALEGETGEEGLRVVSVDSFKAGVSFESIEL